MSALQVLAWTSATAAAYLIARSVHARARSPWTSPFVLAPAMLAVAILASRSDYTHYKDGAGWLTTLLGPATVAFAIPIYEQRALVRRLAGPLVAVAFVGTLTAGATTWALSKLFGLDAGMRATLLPRSSSTPFAMAASARLGGEPGVTTVIVIVTGVVGAILGVWLARRLRLKTTFARGALLGAGAHAIGTTRARELGAAEGAVAALVMVAVGVLHVLGAALLEPWLR